MLSAESLQADKLTPAVLDLDGGKVPLVLLRKGRTIMALSATCTHWGGPLAEGTLIDGECVECPWHGSQFNMADGSVRQGPATVPAHVSKRGSIRATSRSAAAADYTAFACLAPRQPLSLGDC